jgi:hypothetical protein
MKNIPNWKCWASSLIMILTTVPIIYIDEFLFRILGVTLETSEIISVGLMVSFIILTTMLFPIFAYAHIWEFLWGEKDKDTHFLIPHPRSWTEGLWAWVVLLICAAFSMDVVRLIAGGKLSQSLTDTQESVGVLSFFIFVAYAHHFRLKVKAPKPDEPSDTKS